MQEIEIGRIIFPDIVLYKREIPGFRGAISHQFREFDLLHNHAEDGRVLYRYAAIQFKTEKNRPAIFAVGQRAIEIFKPIFLNINSINLHGAEYSVIQKELIIKKEKIGISPSDMVYRLKSPWIALNQVNYPQYISLPDEQKSRLLKRIVINNIIAFSKYVGYTIPEKIIVDLKLKQRKVTIKGEQLLGFIGLLKTNFLLPDGVGLGKSISRGYGIVKKVF